MFVVLGKYCDGVTRAVCVFVDIETAERFVNRLTERESTYAKGFSNEYWIEEIPSVPKDPDLE